MLHCGTKTQAEHVLATLTERMGRVGLELHPDKTRIVYCKDSHRHGSHEHQRFDFLGYTFRPRLATGTRGVFVSFSPAVSDHAAKGIRRDIRRWRLHIRSASTLDALAQEVNPIVRGWISYYGRFYRSRLARSLSRIDDYLVRWATRKYKKLRYSRRKAVAWLATVRRRAPRLFAHWGLVTQPTVG